MRNMLQDFESHKNVWSIAPRIYNVALKVVLWNKLLPTFTATKLREKSSCNMYKKIGVKNRLV